MKVSILIMIASLALSVTAAGNGNNKGGAAAKQGQQGAGGKKGNQNNAKTAKQAAGAAGAAAAGGAAGAGAADAGAADAAGAGAADAGAADAGAAAAGGAADAAAAANSTDTATAAAADAGGAGDAQTSLTLDPGVIASGFANNGQDVPTAGQVASLTSTNNFINFCLTVPNLPITNGKQIVTGSCNPAPMGVIPSNENMPSSKFVFPKNGDVIKSNTAFTITMNVANFQTGAFVNAQENYFAAPQTLNAQGQIVGHSHVVVEAVDSFTQTTPTDPTKFAFFKGLNDAAVNGALTADVADGLPAGTYKLSSINTAANHQPVLVPVAQHGSLDDAVYFTVNDDGQADASTALGGANATADAAAGAATDTGAAATADAGAGAAADAGAGAATDAGTGAAADTAAAATGGAADAAAGAAAGGSAADAAGGAAAGAAAGGAAAAAGKKGQQDKAQKGGQNGGKGKKGKRFAREYF